MDMISELQELRDAVARLENLVAYDRYRAAKDQLERVQSIVARIRWRLRWRLGSEAIALGLDLPSASGRVEAILSEAVGSR